MYWFWTVVIGKFMAVSFLWPIHIVGLSGVAPGLLCRQSTCELQARKAGMKPGPPEDFVVEQIARLTGWDLRAEPVVRGESAE